MIGIFCIVKSIGLYTAKGKFDLAYAADAIVYHKEGASTGFSSNKTNIKSLYYLTRSRLLLTAKHCPWALPTVVLHFFAALRMFWRRTFVARLGFIFKLLEA